MNNLYCLQCTLYVESDRVLGVRRDFGLLTRTFAKPVGHVFDIEYCLYEVKNLISVDVAEGSLAGAFTAVRIAYFVNLRRRGLTVAEKAPAIGLRPRNLRVRGKL